MVTRSASSIRSGEGYPKAASSFAAVLGMSNVDIAAFVPLGRMAPAAGFHLKLQLKTLIRAWCSCTQSVSAAARNPTPRLSARVLMSKRHLLKL